MRIFSVVFLVFLVACFLVARAEARFRVKVRFSEIANLTYQLDCVGDLPVNCSRRNLGELWTREFLKSDEDRRMLKEWARLRGLYAENVQLKKEPGEDAYLDLFDKLRIAGLQAAGIEDYAARLDLLTTPADRNSFESVLRHFHPRFTLWWRREASKNGDEFARATDALLRSQKTFGQIRQFYDFYAPSLPADYEISFNLFYVPDQVREPSGGQQLQNYSLMEFKPGEKPEQRIDVVVHELNHFFYESMSAENKARLAQSFRDLPRAGAIPAYNLLNEALASAFGNGMTARSVMPAGEFEKYLAAPLSFYNNAAIDRAGKAALPLLDEWLKNKRNINDPQFAREYVSVLEKAFGEELLAPKLQLSELFLFVDGDYKVSLRREVRQFLEPASFYNVEGSLSEENLGAFRTFPRLNSLFVVHPDNIGGLVRLKIISAADAALVEKELAAKGEVIFSAERAPFTYVYVVAAKDAESAKTLAEKLSRAKQFRGIYRE